MAPSFLRPAALLGLVSLVTGLAAQVRLAPATDAVGFSLLPGRVFFFANTPGTGMEPWVTDGTPAGTQPVLDLNPGARDSFVAAGQVLGDRVIFRAFLDAVSNAALVASDGTAAGTQALARLGGGGHLNSRMVRFDERAWYLGLDALWLTDGTIAGTRSLPLPMRALAGLAATRTQLFFVLSDLVHPAELWCLDLGLRTPRRVATLPANRTVASDLQATDERVFFLVSSVNPVQTELWSSDGTPGGTHAGLTNVVVLDTLLTTRTHAFVVRLQANNTYSVARSDGTYAGTQDVLSAQLALGTRVEAFGSTAELAVFRHISATGNELWVSDGSLAGSRRLLVNGIPDRAIAASARRQLLFAAPDLWVTDGTVAGTHFVIAPVKPRSGVAAWDLPMGPTLVFDMAGPMALPLARCDTADVTATRTGCAGVFRPIPILDRGAVLPCLGAAFALHTSHIAQNAFGAIFLGASMAPTDACGLAITAPIIIIPHTADLTGRATLQLPIPRDRALIGAWLHAQTLVLASSGAILMALDASNATTVLIGR